MPKFTVGQQVTYSTLGRVGVVVAVDSGLGYLVRISGEHWSVPESSLSPYVSKCKPRPVTSEVDEWIVSESLLGGHRCVQSKHSGELSLIGLYGEIWLKAEGRYGAVIFSHRVAKRYLPKRSRPIGLEDEVQVQFPVSDLNLWAERLRVPVKPSTQAGLANRRRQRAATRSNKTQLQGQILSSAPREALESRPVGAQGQGPGLRVELDPGTENSDQASPEGSSGE